jgi:glycerate 2-kinase
MTPPPGGRQLTVVVAPDSFKGSLTSVEVAAALRNGWLRARPADEVLLAPLADGGEGTLEALHAAGGWERMTVEVADPLMRPVQATWLRSGDGRTAAIEMAQASGLSRVAPDERDPVRATSLGTGQVIDHAVGAGVERMLLGIGGSATTDGGMWLLFALGARPVPGTAETEWDLSGMSDALSRIDMSVACDVTNPLLGPAGAAATYGPQKGATAPQVAQLDDALTAWADRLERAAGRRERDTPGAGAAGGVGFGLLAIQDRFRSFALRPGIDLVMEATGFDDKLAGADLVITGEGRIDAQTAFGKTALGVARRAYARGVPCIAVGGGVTSEGIEALKGLAVAVPVVEQPQSVDEAMAAGSAPLERCGERLARLVSIGTAS